MMIEYPIQQCPVCQHSLHDLAAVGRCPECGWEHDETTVVFRPARRWRTYAGVLGTEAVVFYFVCPMVYALLQIDVGARLARLLMLLLMAGVLVGSGVVIYLANRRLRFAAVSQQGIVVRNLGSLQSIAFDEVATLAVRDWPPSISRRQEASRISLRGLFDSRAEAETFERLVDARGQANVEIPWSCDKRPANASDNDRGAACDGAAARNLQSARSRSWARQLTRVGIVAAVAGVACIITDGLAHSADSSRVLGHVGVIGVWCGAAVTLVGQWYLRSLRTQNMH